MGHVVLCVCVCWTTGMFLIEQLKGSDTKVLTQLTHRGQNDPRSNCVCVCPAARYYVVVLEVFQ